MVHVSPNFLKPALTHPSLNFFATTFRAQGGDHIALTSQIHSRTTIYDLEKPNLKRGRVFFFKKKKSQTYMCAVWIANAGWQSAAARLAMSTATLVSQVFACGRANHILQTSTIAYLFIQANRHVITKDISLDI